MQSGIYFPSQRPKHYNPISTLEQNANVLPPPLNPKTILQAPSRNSQSPPTPPPSQYRNFPTIENVYAASASLPIYTSHTSQPSPMQSNAVQPFITPFPPSSLLPPNPKKTPPNVNEHT